VPARNDGGTSEAGRPKDVSVTASTPPARTPTMPTSPPTAVMALAADPLVADATVSTPNMTVAETRMTALATTARGLNRQPWPNGRQSGSRHALRTVVTLNPASPAPPAAAPVAAGATP
jgi:hypothetical protein